MLDCRAATVPANLRQSSSLSSRPQIPLEHGAAQLMPQGANAAKAEKSFDFSFADILCGLPHPLRDRRSQNIMQSKARTLWVCTRAVSVILQGDPTAGRAGSTDHVLRCEPFPCPPSGCLVPQCDRGSRIHRIRRRRTAVMKQEHRYLAREDRLFE